MDLKEIQSEAVKSVRGMEDKMKPKSGHNDTGTLMTHLIEEFGEVARQVYNDRTGRGQVDKRNLGEEIADVIILLSYLADYYQVNLDLTVAKKLEELKKRYGVQ